MPQETMSFHFTSEDDEGNLQTTNVSMEGDFIVWFDAANRFCEFLRGCGYVIDKSKTLGLVEAP